jgi:hypothetical protein
LPRVRLRLEQINKGHTFRFIHPDGRQDTIDVRLAVSVDLSQNVVAGLPSTWAAYPDCVLDTGSHLTTVPERLHRYLRPGVVTWLPFDPSMRADLRFLAIGGGVFPYELGGITIGLRDRWGGALDVSLIAQFVRDGGTLPIPLLLGLRGGLLEGRRLESRPDPIAPYGQNWMLEE